MKKSLRRKLIMSAVAVGVAAAGTTASTYAWFVSSTEVSSTVSGTVESSGASLFISNDGVSYGTKAVKPTADFSKLKMAPLQMKATNHTLSSLDDGEATKNEDYMSFSLYFSVQNINTTKNNYSIKLSTTATDNDIQKIKTHEAQTAIAEDGTYSAISQGTSLWDNVLKAMNVSIGQQYSSSNSFSAATSTKYYEVNKSEAIYDGLAYFNKITENSKTETDKVTYETNALTTTELETKDNVETKSIIPATGDITVINNITANGYYKLDFNFWLNGWDKACFDAIAAHEFGLIFNFKLEATPKSE